MNNLHLYGVIRSGGPFPLPVIDALH
jgi:hypothetical protein